MNAPSPVPDNVSFGRSADGLLVALVGETAFAMAPTKDGRHYLVTAWRIRRPMEEWTRSDFYGHSGELADEAAFRARVLENAERQRERKMLGRVEERPRLRRHFTDCDAWKRAVRVSVCAPEPYPADADRKEVRS